MMKYLEYAGWTYTIERVEPGRFLVIVFNNDNIVRSSKIYNSLYEAELLTKMTITELKYVYDYPS